VEWILVALPSPPPPPPPAQITPPPPPPPPPPPLALRATLRLKHSGSGELTLPEFKHYLREELDMDPAAVEVAGTELFSLLDVNADRSLSVMEFVFGLRQMPASLRHALLDSVPPAMPQAVFTAASAAQREQHQQKVKELFEHLDLDGDGLLDVKELKVRQRWCFYPSHTAFTLQPPVSHTPLTAPPPLLLCDFTPWNARPQGV
jgi:hypothetical protein